VGSITALSSGFLLDTHVLLWWLFDDPKLSSPARNVIRAPENTILVSSASGWEIATKSRLGKLPQAGSVAEDLPYLLQRARMQVLPITMEHALAAGALPGPHRDPFDRMLIAQGQIEQLPIITSDPEFRNYPVKLIW
jgi:PIN domain nuclease of toxin-antitoxin system